MNKIINKCLLISEPFTEHLERIQKCREAGNLNHLFRNELDKACLAHEAYSLLIKTQPKRTISNQIFKDGAYEIARNRGYDGYRRELANVFNTFFDMKTGSRASANEQLAEENT